MIPTAISTVVDTASGAFDQLLRYILAPSLASSPAVSVAALSPALGLALHQLVVSFLRAP